MMRQAADKQETGSSGRPQTASAGWWLPCCALALLLSGCGERAIDLTYVTHERMTKLVEPARAPVLATLSEKFGTPRQPVFAKEWPVDFGQVDEASLDRRQHKEGWKLLAGAELYRVNCVHCHGVSGDGQGPTGRFLNPRPRDFRDGVFKFTSTGGGMKPSTEDLHRTLSEGIPGTSMPAFLLLGDEKLSLLVNYVKFLTLRGEMEIKLASEVAGMGGSQKEIDNNIDGTDEVIAARKKLADATLAAERDPAQRQAKEQAEEELQAARNKALEPILKELKETLESDYGDSVESMTELVSEAWKTADDEENIVVPKKPRTKPDAESIKRGRELYLSQKAKCLDCHGPTGLGNGPLTEEFWPQPGTTPEQKYEVPGLHDMWRQPQQPRNLVRGVYRGGRRPVDIYRRIFVGIKGTQMAGFGTAS